MSGRLNRRLSEALAPEGDVGDEGESAAHAYEQHTSANLAEAERNELALIDSALERIQQGIYGLDIGTGEPIGFAPRSHAAMGYGRSVPVELDLSKFVSDGWDIILGDDPEPESGRFDFDEGNPTTQPRPSRHPTSRAEEANDHAESLLP